MKTPHFNDIIVGAMMIVAITSLIFGFLRLGSDAETVRKFVITETVEVDGCEYIVFQRKGESGVSALHKNNCKNHNNEKQN